MSACRDRKQICGAEELNGNMAYRTHSLNRSLSSLLISSLSCCIELHYMEIQASGDPTTTRAGRDSSSNSSSCRKADHSSVAYSLLLLLLLLLRWSIRIHARRSTDDALDPNQALAKRLISLQGHDATGLQVTLAVHMRNDTAGATQWCFAEPVSGTTRGRCRRRA